eukprot:2740240-Prymnesium_polylepis.2
MIRQWRTRPVASSWRSAVRHSLGSSSERQHECSSTGGSTAGVGTARHTMRGRRQRARGGRGHGGRGAAARLRGRGKVAA